MGACRSLWRSRFECADETTTEHTRLVSRPSTRSRTEVLCANVHSLRCAEHKRDRPLHQIVFHPVPQTASCDGIAHVGSDTLQHSRFTNIDSTTALSAAQQCSNIGRDNEHRVVDSTAPRVWRTCCNVPLSTIGRTRCRAAAWRVRTSSMFARAGCTRQLSAGVQVSGISSQSRSTRFELSTRDSRKGACVCVLSASQRTALFDIDFDVHLVLIFNQRRFFHRTKNNGPNIESMTMCRLLFEFVMEDSSLIARPPTAHKQQSTNQRCFSPVKLGVHE